MMPCSTICPDETQNDGRPTTGDGARGRRGDTARGKKSELQEFDYPNQVESYFQQSGERWNGARIPI